MKKNKNKKSIFDDKRIVVGLALLLGFLAWVIVAGFVNPGSSKPIPNVPIKYTYNEDVYKERELMIVSEHKDEYVDVQVTGDGAVIGPLAYSSVDIYPDYTQVTGPGTYELPLRYNKVATGNYNVTEWTVVTDGHSLNNVKRTVSVTFEEVETKNFTVNVKADGVAAATGYMKDTPRTDTVELYGPQSKVELVSQVVAEVTAEETLTTQKKYVGVVPKLLDENGGELDPETLGITMTPETLTVEVPILEVHTVKLSVNFVNVPQYFDEDWLRERMQLSVDEVQVAGPSSAFETLSGAIAVTDIDLSQLTTTWESEALTISLPKDSGMRILDEQRTVTVTFDMTGVVEKSFEVAVDESNVQNGPRNATITPQSETVTVKLLGPEEQINNILAENISVRIEAYGISTTTGGQQTIPAQIRVPGFNRTIPMGGYSILCEVELSA